MLGGGKQVESQELRALALEGEGCMLFKVRWCKLCFASSAAREGGVKAVRFGRSLDKVPK